MGRICRRCARSQDLETQFYERGLGSGKYQRVCKTCCRERQKQYFKDPDLRRAYHKKWSEQNKDKVLEARLRPYNLTIDRYDHILSYQNNCCAICGVGSAGDRELHIDHDHACCPKNVSCGQCVRGLLCSRCNVGLGYFLDSPLSLKAAVRYLEKKW